MKDDLQASALQARRRTSLIPQRTTSIKSYDVSRPQPGQAASRSERYVSTNIKETGLQRSQSTKHFVDLKQRQMPSHHRLNSLSCLGSETPRNGPAKRSPGATPFAGKRQFALPTSSQQIASHPVCVLSHTKVNSADAPKSVEAEYEVANEATGKVQDVDMRRRTLISNGNHLKPTRVLQRLEAVNATNVILSADTRVRAPSAKPDRPAFSALQRDFGTQQAPKGFPCLPHSPSDGTMNRVSSEALTPNVELLQLHMLHRSSFATKLQWESSAEEHYRTRFDKLASEHENMIGREMNLQEQTNASAIIAWGSGTDNVPVGIKIRKLSRILNDVVEVSDPSGQYTCLLHSFEHWYTHASRIRQLRATRDSSHPHIERNLEGIGDGWKAEADTLRSKLLAYQEELVFLGEAHSKSDLIRCLDAVLGGLTNMLEELDVIQAIETQILHEEENWLKDSLGRIAADLSGSMSVPFNTEPRR
ncbi:hypothetical protein MMC15_001956 [Xylographa vitiligo]|nr:hypothetical protein [Xylographa vitiligo]